jgi:dethiobiotin synthase
MLRGIFVTGTDTGVGKTVACAALLLRYSGRYREGAGLRYWKPIQTGVEQDDDTAEVQRLSRCGEGGVRVEGVRLRHPVSPHLAARWSGTRIALRPLTHWSDSQDDSTRWIIEGAGGLLVPVNESETIADLMGLLALPVVVAARSELGTINHTLLTLEAVRARFLAVAGVIMIGGKNPDNRAAIEHYGNVPVLGEMPRFEPLQPERLADWAAVDLDPQNRLWEFLK